ncbi:hypothetical protein FGO68_gene7494 [Halteria grandinella]|uniref:Uncharacterized protein n=1 Tax=Halteria grandinella TaxID=5974 RepID=A0A8J8T5B4_HALGN|nr:hypothetical protein FGO68_gene7494 [Halteria grandinella]
MNIHEASQIYNNKGPLQTILKNHGATNQLSLCNPFPRIYGDKKVLKSSSIKISQMVFMPNKTLVQQPNLGSLKPIILSQIDSLFHLKFTYRTNIKQLISKMNKNGLVDK